MHEPEQEQLYSLGARLGFKGKYGKGQGKASGSSSSAAAAPPPRGSIALCLKRPAAGRRLGG